MTDTNPSTDSETFLILRMKDQLAELKTATHCLDLMAGGLDGDEDTNAVFMMVCLFRQKLNTLEETLGALDTAHVKTPRAA
jgi:hypothetical protein